MIRQIDENDLESILEIQRECRLGFWAEDGYRGFLSNPGAIKLAAVEDRQIIGFLTASLIMSAEEAELYNLGVRLKDRRRGIAKLLLNEFAEICKNEYIHKIFLDVRESNLGAIAFYQTFSFQIIGTRKNFYSNPHEDSLLMELSLKNPRE